MSVVTVSVSEAGAAIARRLPHPHVHGDLAATVRERWADVDGFVLVCATGIAVRVIAPLLDDKEADPAVVSVDDGGRFAVALAGGHRGANDLARDVAAAVGAQAVVTTATDAAGLPALDAIPGWVARGDVAGVTRQWLDGRAPTIDDEVGWPLPNGLAAGPGPDAPAPGPSDRAAGPCRIRITDRAQAPGEDEVVLHPPTLILGVGSSSGAPPADLAALVESALAEAGLSAHSVGAVATVDLKADEPAIGLLARDLQVPLHLVPPAQLAAVDVPTPSEVVEAAVGTPSVAEAAALVAAGPEAQLVVAKRRSTTATVALARRPRPEGHLAVVGLGPGDASTRTPEATAAVRHAEVVVGYGPYIDLVTDLLAPHQHVVRSPIGAESDRCREALERAARGERVALVCSGDAGIYAMASHALELAPELGSPPVSVVPGVTAALAAAARLGAPLGHDHAAISLSDLLTPWPLIEDRLRAVAGADLVVSLYNPRSARRTWQLDRARELLLEGRPAGTPVGVVTDAGRPAEKIVLTTLGDLDTGAVGMLAIVIVGSSQTQLIAGRMVTPRGYSG